MVGIVIGCWWNGGNGSSREEVSRNRVSKSARVVGIGIGGSSGSLCHATSVLI